VTTLPICCAAKTPVSGMSAVVLINEHCGRDAIAGLARGLGAASTNETVGSVKTAVFRPELASRGAVLAVGSKIGVSTQAFLQAARPWLVVVDMESNPLPDVGD
jgi:hypothetical protein